MKNILDRLLAALPPVQLGFIASIPANPIELDGAPLQKLITDFFHLFRSFVEI